MRIPGAILMGLLAASAVRADAGGGLFDDPITLFSDALLPALSHSERAKVETTMRGFCLRADTHPGMREAYDPSEAGIYLNVAVRDPEEIPSFSDVTATHGSITTRSVGIPAPKGEAVALRITLVHGKDAPEAALAAIRRCIARTIHASRTRAEAGPEPNQGKDP